jgi:hypothetical protein
LSSRIKKRNIVQQIATSTASGKCPVIGRAQGEKTPLRVLKKPEPKRTESRFDTERPIKEGNKTAYLSALLIKMYAVVRKSTLTLQK